MRPLHDQIFKEHKKPTETWGLNLLKELGESDPNSHLEWLKYLGVVESGKNHLRINKVVLEEIIEKIKGVESQNAE